jgi:hypothetical protein
MTGWLGRVAVVLGIGREFQNCVGTGGLVFDLLRRQWRTEGVEGFNPPPPEILKF